jgi:dihydropyrimidinase
VKKALAEGKTAPKYHALTRPARAEAEATHRAIALAEMADVPIYIVHLSASEALEMVTEARDRGLPRLPRPARSICFSPTTTTRSRASRARST